MKADIQSWATNYPTIDGIFVDEVTNLWPDSGFDSFVISEAFYDDIVANITGTNVNWVAVLNPAGPYNPALTEGNARVLATVYEQDAALWNPSTSCAAIQRDSINGLYGSFAKGPWCAFVPGITRDGIELLKDEIDNDDITQDQNIALIYNVAVDKPTVSAIVQ